MVTRPAMRRAADDLDEYIKFRAIKQGVGYSLSPDWFYGALRAGAGSRPRRGSARRSNIMIRLSASSATGTHHTPRHRCHGCGQRGACCNTHGSCVVR
jgi:hypothetical protein